MQTIVVHPQEGFNYFKHVLNNNLEETIGKYIDDNTIQLTTKSYGKSPFTCRKVSGDNAGRFDINEVKDAQEFTLVGGSLYRCIGNVCSYLQEKHFKNEQGTIILPHDGIYETDEFYGGTLSLNDLFEIDNKTTKEEFAREFQQEFKFRGNIEFGKDSVFLYVNDFSNRKDCLLITSKPSKKELVLSH